MSAWFQRISASALILICAACAGDLRPDPGAIEPWTAELAAAQPDDAFAAIYVRNRVHLAFMGAHHANQTESLTFRLIDDAYKSFSFSVLIAEGFPYSWGPNPQRILDSVNRATEVDGFVEDGEFVPAVRGALAQGAQIRGGEPDDGELRERLLSRGFAREDLLGFYTLRSVPQWIRERRIDGAGDARVNALLEAELEHNRGRLGLATSVLPDLAAWRAWYQQTNGRPFGAAFELEEVGPRADGRYGTNRLAAAIGDARDSFLLEKIAAHMNAGENVIVVFGESHLMVLRPALDRMVGAPCYVGVEMRDAARACLR